MRVMRFLPLAALAATLVLQPAAAQNKAAMARANGEFYKLASGLSTSLADLGKRIGTASPNDRDMLKLAVNQLGVVNANAQGILELGALSTELRDGGDVGIVKKHLAAGCESFRASTEASAKYLDSLIGNIAAVATAAEVGRARDLLVQMGQSPLCGPAKP